MQQTTPSGRLRGQVLAVVLTVGVVFYGYLLLGAAPA
jgi:hypothetical protein